MSQWPDGWDNGFWDGWLSPRGIYRPSPIPPEFRRENEDLAIPRHTEELDVPDRFLLFRPYF